MMETFDIVIVGAGPAGGHCGRVLSQLGYQVLVVEQQDSLEKNSFSSAASPLEILQQFNLPDSIVASFWRKLEIISTKVNRYWEAENHLGVVFDFAKLRQFLADEVEKNGGEVWLGHRYVNCEKKDEITQVILQKKGGKKRIVNTKILVDATGYARSVMYPNKKDKPRFYRGTGIEYLLQVSPEIYQKYANKLVFFLGYKWSPKGYGWIFPMDKDNHCLKVGSAWMDENHILISDVKPLRHYLQGILQDYLKLDNYKLIDSHGSILDYSPNQKDKYYKDNIIAIGDAVSTVNFLGGEGIRHGMRGAEIAAKYIDHYLEKKIDNFQPYETEMQKTFAKVWNQCEKINRRVYLEYSDRRIDQGVAYLKYLDTSDILDILFNYRLEKASKGVKNYLWFKLNRFWQKVMSIFRQARQF